MTLPFPGRWGLVAAACLLATGCVHYPSSPSYYNSGGFAPGPTYGPSYAPSMAPSGGYMNPGPVYAPQGPTLQPLPGNPSSPTPIGTPQPAPTWRPDNSSTTPSTDAPPFRPNNPANNSTNPVPFPLEPDFSAPPTGAMLPRAMPVAESPGVSSRPVSNVASADPFEAPRRVQPLPTEVDPFTADVSNAQVSKQDPYGYDGAQYTWLRGMVDFDDRTRTWSIIYNLTPDIRDKFGGSFVFANHPSLAGLRPGSLVLAKGRIDPGHTDSTGKALYEISQLIHLAPPSGIQ